MKTIERNIITAIVERLGADGYAPAAVYNGHEYILTYSSGKPGRFPRGGEWERINKPLTLSQVLRFVNEEPLNTLHFTHQNAKTWGNRGVYLVMGNGESVVSDYHTPQGEAFTKVLNAMVRRIIKGELL